MLAKLYSKSFKLGFSSTWTKNFQIYKLGLEKAEEPEIKLPTFIESWRKQGIPEKHLLLLHWLYKSLCVDHSKLWKILAEVGIAILPASWETCMQFKKQQLEPHMEQLSVSKLGKEYSKAVYCLPSYLTYM